MRIRTRRKFDDGSWEYVYGWYVCFDGKHFIACDDEFEYLDYGESLVRLKKIDPAHTAKATGKKDKNDVEIFGSERDFADGDIVIARSHVGQHDVVWSLGLAAWICSPRQAAWIYSTHSRLGIWPTEELEIISKEQE